MNRYGWVALTLVLVATHYGAYRHGQRMERLVAVEAANTAHSVRDTLQRKINERDQQLADAQARVDAVRTETITKWEVVYRDRIKTVTVRDCVADSGMFQLYNASLGVDGKQ